MRPGAPKDEVVNDTSVPISPFDYSMRQMQVPVAGSGSSSTRVLEY